MGKQIVNVAKKIIGKDPILGKGGENPTIVQAGADAPAAAPATAAVDPKTVDSGEESQAENANKRRKGKRGVTINRVSGGGSGLNI